MLLRDNIKVYKTINMNETLRFLKNFIWKMQTQGTDFMKQYTIDDYHEANMKMKLSKKKGIDKHTCFMYQLCQIKGVSQSIAKAITDKYKSWLELYKVLEKYSNDIQKFECIARIEVPVKAPQKKQTEKQKKTKKNTRKIGNTIACRIYSYMFT